MSKAERFLEENVRNDSNIMEGYHPNGKQAYFPWIPLRHARKAVEIVREEMIEKACRGYCDDICEKGMAGMCFHKHDGQSQVKNTFKYNECNELQILINAMRNE